MQGRNSSLTKSTNKNTVIWINNTFLIVLLPEFYLLIDMVFNSLAALFHILKIKNFTLIACESI